MWTNLTLKAFKCHESLSLPLAPLTLLTGFNAAGKSSVIQALALLNQTVRRNRSGRRIVLNGDCVRLGSVRDVVNTSMSRGCFSIGLASSGCEVTWSTWNDDRSELTASIDAVEIRSLDNDGGPFVWRRKNIREKTGITRIPSKRAFDSLLPSTFRRSHFPQHAVDDLAHRLRSLTYICAERIGPRETYEMFPEDGDRTVGVGGERTAWLLDEFGGEIDAIEGMRLPGVAPKIQHQVGRWLQEFFPGVEFQLIRVPDASLVTLKIRSNEASEFFRPQNVGYGITHVLPIVVACVCANVGDVLLIENPEAHLHPAGQSRMGGLLAKAAAAGVQVLVETHSDHVLNGIRVAVKKAILPPRDLKIHYFESDSAGKIRVKHPRVDRNGKIENWPHGFFDETQRLLLELL